MGLVPVRRVPVRRVPVGRDHLDYVQLDAIPNGRFPYGRKLLLCTNEFIQYVIIIISIFKLKSGIIIVLTMF